MDIILSCEDTNCHYLWRIFPETIKFNGTISSWHLLYCVMQRNGYSNMGDCFNISDKCIIVVGNNNIIVPLGNNYYKVYEKYTKVFRTVLQSDIEEIAVGKNVQFIRPVSQFDNIHDYFNDIFLKALGLASEDDHIILEKEVRREFISV
jgi:hypothetical protein